MCEEIINLHCWILTKGTTARAQGTTIAEGDVGYSEAVDQIHLSDNHIMQGDIGHRFYIKELYRLHLQVLKKIIVKKKMNKTLTAH